MELVLGLRSGCFMSTITDLATRIAQTRFANTQQNTLSTYVNAGGGGLLFDCSSDFSRPCRPHNYLQAVSLRSADRRSASDTRTSRACPGDMCDCSRCRRSSRSRWRTCLRRPSHGHSRLVDESFRLSMLQLSPRMPSWWWSSKSSGEWFLLLFHFALPFVQMSWNKSLEDIQD